MLNKDQTHTHGEYRARGDQWEDKAHMLQKPEKEDAQFLRPEDHAKTKRHAFGRGSVVAEIILPYAIDSTMMQITGSD